MKRRQFRSRACADCGRIDRVRADAPSARCRRCAAKRAGQKSGEKKRRFADLHRPECENCGAKHSNRRFCSPACRFSTTARLWRICKLCKQPFAIRKSALKSNAAGNFCSRPCYAKFLCQTDKITDRGSQWKRIRAEALRRTPCCALCGGRKRLQVHHAIPYRISRDNSQDNLVPLCGRHHRLVESLFAATEAEGLNGTGIMIWRNMIAEWKLETLAALKGASLGNSDLAN
jgi:hypothetical protein